MKKFLKITGITLAVILLLLFVLPILFKDKIKGLLDAQIAKSVNATVFYDANKFGLSFFKQFPSITATLGNFGVIGNEPFKGDTLLSMKEFNVSLDIISVISGDQIKINSILLDNPYINVIVLKNGKANYDIAKPSTDTTKTEDKGEPSKFNISINKWEIIDAKLIYDDRKSPMYAKLVGLNHTGNGDFTQDVLDLNTKTTVDSISYTQDTIPYLSNHRLDITLNMLIDKLNSKYTFKDNTFKINDFALGLDGFVQQNKDSSMAMDLVIKSKETAFSSVLSLVPVIFMKDFKELKTSGEFSFDAYAKGIYFKRQYPNFGLNLIVKNGFFQYPKLPSAVKNVAVNLNVTNQSPNLENLIVDLKNMHLEMGSNPFDAKFYMKGMTKKYFDANLKGIVNLEEVTQIYPMNGMTLKGIFGIDATAKGNYDSTMKTLPTIAANMTLKDGYVKTDKVPAPIEQINMEVSIQNATGLMKDMLVNLKSFQMLFENQPFEAKATVADFTDYTYDAHLKGILNMEKLTKIYPLEDKEIKGLIDLNMNTQGKMSLITAKKYDQLPTSGNMDFKNFSFKSKSFTQGIVLNEARILFDPKQISIPLMKGTVGKSDIDLTGTFTNYMAYVFQNETLAGKMTFHSNKFDVNEWTGTDSEKPKEEKPAPTNKSVAAIPKNLDIILVANLKKVLYSTYDISNLAGIITLKDGVFVLNKGYFNLLDADFNTNMKYDTKDLLHPLFAFDLDIKNLQIKKAYDNFEMVKKLASVAKDVDGNVSTNFIINGELGQDYSPLYPTMNGKGTITVNDAVVRNISYISEAKRLTKLDIPQEYKLQNTTIQAEVVNGRVIFKPFDVNAGNVKMNIGGSQGLDQTIDYAVKTSVPVAGMGQAASNALSSVFGKAIPAVKSMLVSMKVTGTNSAPKVAITSVVPEGADGGDVAKQTLDMAKKEAEAKIRAEADRLKNEAETKVRAEADRLAREAMDRAAQEAAKRGADDALRKATEEAKKRLPNIKFP